MHRGARWLTDWLRSRGPDPRNQLQHSLFVVIVHRLAIAGVDQALGQAFVREREPDHYLHIIARHTARRALGVARTPRVAKARGMRRVGRRGISVPQPCCLSCTGQQGFSAPSAPNPWCIASPAPPLS